MFIYQMKLLTWLICIITVLADLKLINQKHTEATLYAKYKSELQLYQLSNKIVSQQLMLSGQDYWCYIPIANTLIPSRQLNISDINFQSAEPYLQPLKGKCAQYRTKEFIYQLCYGKQVRQLDDQITKNNMGKSQLQNFLLGSANPAKHEIQNQQFFPPYYLYISNKIGRFYYLENTDVKIEKQIQTISLTCQGNSQTIKLKIMWIGSTEFMVISNFSGECYSNLVEFMDDRKVSNFTQYNFPKPYENTALVLTYTTQLFSFENNKLVLVDALRFFSEYLVEVQKGKIPSKTILFPITELLPGQVLHQNPVDWKMTDFKKQDKYMVFSKTTPLMFRMKEVPTPEKFKEISEEISTMATIFKIQKRVAMNYTLPKTQSPINFIRIEAGDKLLNLSSDEYIQISSLKPGGIIILSQQNGWEYYLIGDGKSFRSKTYNNNYSKEIQMQNKFYENKTAEKFFVFRGIYGIYDDPREQTSGFFRLPISGRYTISSSDGPVIVRIFNMDSKYNKHLMGVKQMKLPPREVKTTAQKYSNGEYCPAPINVFRSTNVIYKCGNSWFSIKEVSEKSNCVYQLIVETRLLCPEGSTFNEQEQENRQTVCLNEKLNIH